MVLNRGAMAAPPVSIQHVTPRIRPTAFWPIKTKAMHTHLLWIQALQQPHVKKEAAHVDWEHGDLPRHSLDCCLQGGQHAESSLRRCLSDQR